MGSHLASQGMQQGNMGLDDEIIPTAIVIKNIPFNVKRETLLDIIVRMSIERSRIVLDVISRFLSIFPPLMRSTTTSTQRARSVASHLPTSVSHMMLMPW